MKLNYYFKEIRIWRLFLIFFLTLILKVILDKTLSLSPYITTEFICYLGIFFWFWGIFKHNHVNIYIEFTKKITKQSIREAFFLLILNILFSFGITLLIFSLNDSALLEKSSIDINYLKIIINLIVILFLAPIVEELIFRGILLNRLSKWVNITISITISSILFGVLHNDIVGAFIFALCMCIIYLKTNNIFVPIYVHFFNNLISSLPDILSLFTANNSSIQEKNIIYFQYFFKIFGVILISISGVIIIWYLFENWPKKSTD